MPSTEKIWAENDDLYRGPRRDRHGKTAAFFSKQYSGPDPYPGTTGHYGVNGTGRRLLLSWCGQAAQQ